jgi:CheY-like chemotaxis protein
VLLGVANPATLAALLEPVRANSLRAIVESDGEHALRRALAERPSMVILEHHLPGIDGPGVCRAIRRGGGGGAKDLPIIIVTEREDNVTAGGAEGVDDWLVMPFSAAYARARIRAWQMRSACRWVPPPVPGDEQQRLTALRQLGILDTPPEERFDRLTRLAAALFDVPIVLVSLVDFNRQWFKSSHGIGVRETTRETSFCAHAVASRAMLVVPDALLDDRFADNPLVVDGPRIRFYAGQPLILPSGSCVGTLCLVDTRPRQLDENAIRLLVDLGLLVGRELLLPAEAASSG